MRNKRDMRQRKRRRRAGITLIEMLVVITIVALFSAVAFQQYSGIVDQGRQTAAQTQIEQFSTAAQRHYIEYGRFPTEEEGLQALRPYLAKDIGLDPWQRPYEYRYPGEHGPDPDLICYGADGAPGGEGPNEDVVSWR